MLHLVEDLLDISGLLEPASRLTMFSTTPRYPSFLAPETAQDAEMAIGIAKDIIAQVLGEIPT
ncbi:MAG: hypothetical protein FJ098_04160 [Deltaproteobacteria bacterium]|nr:hypothetical protein [Deltaproteobacteria bacterium]